MSNPSPATGPEGSYPLPCCIPHSPLAPPTSYPAGYQQALADFAITDLLGRLKTYTDASFDAARVALKTQEAETLAALLIQTLTTHLNGKLLAAYLTVLRCQTAEATLPIANLQLSLPKADLPATFPQVEIPRFRDGDRLRWQSHGEMSDWGIAIGRFYSFAPHRCRWRWCYLIWLDSDSPSAAWIKADLAWEDDLEPLEAP